MIIAKQIKAFGIAAAATVALTSCHAPKDVVYFQDMTQGNRIEVAAQQTVKVRPDDRLSILVNSKDPQLAALFNLPVMSQRINANMGHGDGTPNLDSSSGTATYVVDSYGDIQFPVLGTIHIAGMTRQEVAEYIRHELISRNLVKDPTVTVDFLNHGVTVLGEVKNPGRLGFDRDRFTLIDAIGEAGDLTIKGMRDNVLVLRNEDGRQVSYRVDLTDSSSLLQSPVYYLQQDDIIYVTPNNARRREAGAAGNVWQNPSFWMSVASFLVSVAVLAFK